MLTYLTGHIIGSPPFPNRGLGSDEHVPLSLTRQGRTARTVFTQTAVRWASRYRSISAAKAQLDGLAGERPPPTNDRSPSLSRTEHPAGRVGSFRRFVPVRRRRGASSLTHALSSRQLAAPKHASFTTGQGYPWAAASDSAGTLVALRASSVAAQSQPAPHTSCPSRGIQCTCAVPRGVDPELDAPTAT